MIVNGGQLGAQEDEDKPHGDVDLNERGNHYWFGQSHKSNGGLFQEVHIAHQDTSALSFRRDLLQNGVIARPADVLVGCGVELLLYLHGVRVHRKEFDLSVPVLEPVLWVADFALL